MAESNLTLQQISNFGREINNNLGKHEEATFLDHIILQALLEYHCTHAACLGKDQCSNWKKTRWKLDLEFMESLAEGGKMPNLRGRLRRI